MNSVIDLKSFSKKLKYLVHNSFSASIYYSAKIKILLLENLNLQNLTDTPSKKIKVLKAAERS